MRLTPVFEARGIRFTPAVPLTAARFRA